MGGSLSTSQSSVVRFTFAASVAQVFKMKLECNKCLNKWVELWLLCPCLVQEPSAEQDAFEHILQCGGVALNNESPDQGIDALAVDGVEDLLGC